MRNGPAQLVTKSRGGIFSNCSWVDAMRTGLSAASGRCWFRCARDGPRLSATEPLREQAVAAVPGVRLRGLAGRLLADHLQDALDHPGSRANPGDPRRARRRSVTGRRVEPIGRISAWLSVSATALSLVAQVWRQNFAFPADAARNPYVYSHTSPDVLRLVKCRERGSRRAAGPLEIRSVDHPSGGRLSPSRGFPQIPWRRHRRHAGRRRELLVAADVIVTLPETAALLGALVSSTHRELQDTFYLRSGRSRARTLPQDAARRSPGGAARRSHSTLLILPPPTDTPDPPEARPDLDRAQGSVPILAPSRAFFFLKKKKKKKKKKDERAGHAPPLPLQP